MRSTLALALVFLAVPAMAAQPSGAQRLGRALAPVQVTSNARGLRLTTYDTTKAPTQQVLKIETQRPDGKLVTRERQSFVIEGKRYAGQVRTVNDGDVTWQTTHIFGHSTRTVWKSKPHVALTPLRAYARATAASPAFKIGVLATLSGAAGATGGVAVASAFVGAGMGAALVEDSRRTVTTTQTRTTTTVGHD